MPQSRKRVLFICTGNSCRSQMGEALLRHIASDKFEAVSAGTRPAGFVHPLALRTLESMGVSTEGLESKHFEELAECPIDIAITVRDNASAECPSWFRSGLRVHWGLPDPSFHTGSEDERTTFCREIAERLKSKITRLAALPLGTMSPSSLEQELLKLVDV